MKQPVDGVASKNATTRARTALDDIFERVLVVCIGLPTNWDGPSQ